MVLLFREVGKTTRVSVRSQMKGDIDEYFSESSSESEEEEESQDRRQVSLDILEGVFNSWGHVCSAFLETLSLTLYQTKYMIFNTLFQTTSMNQYQ